MLSPQGVTGEKNRCMLPGEAVKGDETLSEVLTMACQVYANEVTRK